MSNEESALSVQTDLAQEIELTENPLCTAYRNSVIKPFDKMMEEQARMLSTLKSLDGLGDKLDAIHADLIELIYMILEYD